MNNLRQLFKLTLRAFMIIMENFRMNITVCKQNGSFNYQHTSTKMLSKQFSGISIAGALSNISGSFLDISRILAAELYKVSNIEYV